jgi:hypothetical protein
VSPSTEPSPAHPSSAPAAPPVIERLWPSVWVWLGVAVFAGFCGAVALPFGAVPGAVTAVVVLVVTAGLLAAGTPTVGVRDGEFVAGRAHVPLGLLGEVAALRPDEMRRAYGPDLDARAFLCLRGWIRAGLRADLADPQDPTPYWLVSCRRPQRLRDAIERSRAVG